ALHRLGVEVVGVGLGPSVGGLTDPEIQSYAANTLSKEMPLYFDGVHRLSRATDGITVHSNGLSWTVDKVLVSIGRRPALQNLGLENLGIPVDARGIPKFNPNTGQISDL